MKGVIFNLVEEIVVSSHGDETWERLLDQAGVGGAYTSLGSYDDSELMRLIAAASVAFKLPEHDVLRWIGRHAMPLMIDRWPGFFAAHRATTPFLRSLNSIIHPEVHKLYAGATCPHFDFAESTDGALLIGYRSKRRLCELAYGFIQGAALHYRETAELRHVSCMHSGDKSCLLSARLTANRERLSLLPPTPPLLTPVPPGEQLSAQYAIMQRRLARERETRLQAEAIAEQGLRALYEQQQELEFLVTTANMANQSGSLPEILGAALRHLCRYIGWAAAHAYILSGPPGRRRLLPSNVWHAEPGCATAPLREATMNCALEYGQGIAGSAWSTASHVWVCDFADDNRFLRSEAALASGLQACFAIPLLIGDDVVAVLEFFAAAPIVENPKLVQAIGRAATQLSRVIERDRAQDRLHDSLHDALTELPNRRQFPTSAGTGRAPAPPRSDRHVLSGIYRPRQIQGCQR